jgi:hypothetical protein
MHDLLEIWLHGHAGDSLRAMARHVGVDRQTLRTYLQGAEAAGYRPHQPGVTHADGVALYRQHVPAGPRRPRTAPALLVPYHARIVAGLTPNTVTTVWLYLVKRESPIWSSEFPPVRWGISHGQARRAPVRRSPHRITPDRWGPRCCEASRSLARRSDEDGSGGAGEAQGTVASPSARTVAAAPRALGSRGPSGARAPVRR